MQHRTIRENAEAARVKTIKWLGTTILVAWSSVFAQFARAAEMPDWPRESPSAIDHAALERDVQCRVFEYWGFTALNEILRRSGQKLTVSSKESA